jgi:hypothetical protein
MCSTVRQTGPIASAPDTGGLNVPPECNLDLAVGMPYFGSLFDF